jgi:hypothetical protein
MSSVLRLVTVPLVDSVAALQTVLVAPSLNLALQPSSGHYLSVNVCKRECISVSAATSNAVNKDRRHSDGYFKKRHAQSILKVCAVSDFCCLSE